MENDSVDSLQYMRLCRGPLVGGVQRSVLLDCNLKPPLLNIGRLSKVELRRVGRHVESARLVRLEQSSEPTLLMISVVCRELFDGIG